MTTPPSESSSAPGHALWLDLVAGNQHAGGARMSAPNGPPANGLVDTVDETREEPLDIEARQARSRLRAWIIGEEPDAPRIGRFVVLERLGAGGMGAVYAAYDPELDRRVALKFLHPDRADDRHAQHRLLREAQALARLSHPHLVEVYEVGRHEHEIYLAMEHVAGLTVGVWIERTKPDWREVLRVWLEAGHALALVHAEGLVHRDVKPTNVIVGDDGKARLVDFGLAREVGGLSSRPGVDEIGSSPASSGSRLREAVTQSRAVIGTPAYLAPEQRLGEPVAPSADQYSFCVALYEGLYGCRPPGPVGAGETLEVPDPGAVPAVIRKVLARGLSQRPKDRYPSMAALLEALEQPLRRRRVGGWVGAFGIAGLAVAAITGWVRPDAAVVPCADAGTEIDAVWTEDVRAGLRDGRFSTALASVDAFAEQWSEARRDVCEATHVRGVQSPEALDRRVACLDRQREQLVAVVRADAVTHPAALASLPAPSDCKAPGVLDGGWGAPDPALVGEVAVIRESLARARVSAFIDGVSTARVEGLQALRRARAVGYEPALAEALLVMGVIERLAYRASESRAAIEECIELAEAGGDVALKEEALGHLVRVAIDVESDADAALRAWRRNSATLRRLGDSRSRSAALLGRLGLLQKLQEDPTAAEISLRAAVSLYEAEGERAAPALAATLYNLADILTVQRRAGVAQAVLERAQTLNPHHVDGDSWSGMNAGEASLALGRARLGEGDFDAAGAAFAEALREYEDAFGPASVGVGDARAALAAVAVAEGELEQARIHAGASDRAYRQSVPLDDQRRLSPLTAIGTVAYEEGRVEEALVAFGAAVDLAEQNLGEQSAELAQQRSNFAEALLLDGQVMRAAQLARDALSVMEMRLGPDDPDLAFPLRALGEAHTRQGDAERGLELLGRALLLHQQHDTYPTERARTRAWLARAQLAAGRKEAARETAALAVEELRALGPSYASEVRAMRALADLEPAPVNPTSTTTTP